MSFENPTQNNEPKSENSTSEKLSVLSEEVEDLLVYIENNGTPDEATLKLRLSAIKSQVDSLKEAK